MLLHQQIRFSIGSMPLDVFSDHKLRIAICVTRLSLYFTPLKNNDYIYCVKLKFVI
jgi:hypothetical protein